MLPEHSVRGLEHLPADVNHDAEVLHARCGSLLAFAHLFQVTDAEFGEVKRYCSSRGCVSTASSALYLVARRTCRRSSGDESDFPARTAGHHYAGVEVGRRLAREIADACLVGKTSDDPQRSRLRSR